MLNSNAAGAARVAMRITQRFGDEVCGNEMQAESGGQAARLCAVAACGPPGVVEAPATVRACQQKGEGVRVMLLSCAELLSGSDEELHTQGTHVASTNTHVH